MTLPGFLAVDAQELNFNIIRSSDTVGKLVIRKTTLKNGVKYQATSQASTRFVMEVLVNTFEESVFENGKLVYSFLKRNINHKETTCKETRFENQEYHLYAGGVQSPTPIREAIQFNVISLYFSEPLSLKKIYSDAYQQWVLLEKISKGHYKLLMPDKDYNEYFYQNGICTRVVLHHKFYKAEFLYTQKKL